MGPWLSRVITVILIWNKYILLHVAASMFRLCARFAQYIMIACACLFYFIYVRYTII